MYGSCAYQVIEQSHEQDSNDISHDEMWSIKAVG